MIRETSFLSHATKYKATKLFIECNRYSKNVEINLEKNRLYYCEQSLGDDNKEINVSLGDEGIKKNHLTYFKDLIESYKNTSVMFPGCSKCATAITQGAVKSANQNRIIPLISIRGCRLCNLYCRMCGIGMHNILKTTPQFDYTTYNNTLEFVVNNITNNVYKDYFIALCGGEIFINSLSLPLVKAATKTNMQRLNVVSNMSIINDEYLSLMNNITSKIFVSVDATNEIYKYLRGVDFNLIINNVKKVKDKYPNIDITHYNIVISPFNVKDLYNLCKVLTDNFGKDILLKIKHTENIPINWMPAPIKNAYAEELESYTTFFNSLKFVQTKESLTFDYILQLLKDKESNLLKWNSLVNHTKELDKIQKISTLDVLPEFEPYWNSK